MTLSRILRYFPVALALLAPASAEVTPLKAVTWNIEWYPGGHPNASRQEQSKQIRGARKELKKIAPDIFLAQEITEEKAFAKLVKTVPGLKVDVFSKFPSTPGRDIPQQECAIASNLKVDSAWFETFKPAGNLPNLRRGFAFAALGHPGGGLIMTYSVHLKSNGGSDTPAGEKDVADTRAESVRQLISHKAAMEEKFAGRKIVGWLIGGDLNTNHDGQFPMCTAVRDLEMAGFHNTWDATPKDQRRTWRSDPDPADRRFQPTTFDYMMTAGFAKTQAAMVPDVPRELSDHNPVMLMLSPASEAE